MYEMWSKSQAKNLIIIVYCDCDIFISYYVGVYAPPSESVVASCYLLHVYVLLMIRTIVLRSLLSVNKLQRLVNASLTFGGPTEIAASQSRRILVQPTHVVNHADQE